MTQCENWIGGLVLALILSPFIAMMWVGVFALIRNVWRKE